MKKARFPRQNETQDSCILQNFFVASLFLIALTFVYHSIGELFFALPDDHWALLKNQNVGNVKFGWPSLRDILLANGEIQYSPVNTLFYGFIYQINGYDPYYFHLASLILHFFNVILVYSLCVAILKAFDINNEGVISFLTALLWGIHPLNVEPVVWISASKILLYSCFTLLSFLMFIKAIKQGQRRCFFYVCLYFILSLLCKEQAIINPCIFLAYYIFFAMQKGKRKINPHVYLFFFIIGLICIGFFLIQMRFQSGSFFSAPIKNYSVYENVILSFYCLRFYITSAVFPMFLQYHYPFPFAPGESVSVIFRLYPIVFLFVCYLSYLYVRKMKERFFSGFCLFFFVIQISLVLQIIPMPRLALMADRYMYISLIPLLLGFIQLVFNFVNIGWSKYPKIKRIIFYIAVTIYLLYLMNYSASLVQNWGSLNLIEYEKR